VGSEPLILLDSHALVWLASDDKRLGRRARATTDRSLVDGKLAVSAISFWEIALLVVKRRLELGRPPRAWRNGLLDGGLLEIKVDGDIAIAAAQLGDFHDDPADRFIVATASVTGATLLTTDQRILDWKGSLRRQDAAE
jgi:PIN domain nuclease of toxin-antitoxin system